MTSVRIQGGSAVFLLVIAVVSSTANATRIDRNPRDICRELLLSPFGRALTAQTTAYGQPEHVGIKLAQIEDSRGGDRENLINALIDDQIQRTTHSENQSYGSTWKQFVQVAEFLKRHGEFSRLRALLHSFTTAYEGEVLETAQSSALAQLLNLVGPEQEMSGPLNELAQSHLNRSYAYVIHQIVRATAPFSMTDRTLKLLLEDLTQMQREMPTEALPLEPAVTIAKLKASGKFRRGTWEKAEDYKWVTVRQLFEPGSLASKVKLISALPFPQQDREMYKLLELGKSYAVWADLVPDDRDNEWKSAQNKSQTLLEFSEQVLRQFPRPVASFDPPAALQSYRTDLVLEAMAGHANAEFIVPLLLQLEPSHATNYCLERFAKEYPQALPDDVTDRLVEHWQASNRATAEYYLRARGGLEPRLPQAESFLDDEEFPPPLTGTHAENSHYYVAHQLQLATYLMKTGEIYGIQRGLRMIEDLSAEVVRTKSRYLVSLLDEPFASAGVMGTDWGRLRQEFSFSPLEGKINAYLSAAKLAPEQGHALVTKAYRLAENIAEIKPQIWTGGEIHTFATISRLIMALFDVGEVQLATALYHRWDPDHEAILLGHEGIALNDDSKAGAAVLNVFFNTVIRCRVLLNLRDEKQIQGLTRLVLKSFDQPVPSKADDGGITGPEEWLELEALLRSAIYLGKAPKFQHVRARVLNRSIKIAVNFSLARRIDFLRRLVDLSLHREFETEALLGFIAKIREDLGTASRYMNMNSWIKTLVNLASQNPPEPLKSTVESLMEGLSNTKPRGNSASNASELIDWLLSVGS